MWGARLLNLLIRRAGFCVANLDNAITQQGLGACTAAAPRYTTFCHSVLCTPCLRGESSLSSDLNDWNVLHAFNPRRAVRPTQLVVSVVTTL